MCPTPIPNKLRQPLGAHQNRQLDSIPCCAQVAPVWSSLKAAWALARWCFWINFFFMLEWTTLNWCHLLSTKFFVDPLGPWFNGFWYVPDVLRKELIAPAQDRHGVEGEVQHHQKSKVFLLWKNCPIPKKHFLLEWLKFGPPGKI